ncbi:hypothetical protein [Kitasatospora sp. NPDC097691]|uniref:hypothetical protein n=1 Tax=Kitasatospora sp. NPDC097691 TaxID=3157231 RepID=UPI00331A9947
MSERSELGSGGRAQPHASAVGSGEVDAFGEVDASGGVETSGKGRAGAPTRWPDVPVERREARA